MIKFFISCVLFLFISSSCSVLKLSSALSTNHNVQLDTFRLFDQSRQREIPIATYQSNVNSKGIVVFNHGYGHNYQKNYLVYSYLTNFLASNGYFVVSIQHELPTDSTLPFTGIPQVVRLPFWERGVENIMFVINTLKTTNPTLDFEHIALIGHSNGGDMAALFPQKYPNIVDKVITLDHLRVTLPKQYGLSVYSLRSIDKTADEGVLLTEEERDEYGISLQYLHKVKHNDMNDFGKQKSKKKIQNFVLDFMLN